MPSLSAWPSGGSPRRVASAGALLAPALIPAGLVAASEAARGAALLSSPLEDPGRAGFMAVYLARAGALVALATGVTWMLLRTRRTRTRVASLAAELGAAPAPGTLRDALRAALGDRTVDVLYWVPAIDGFVDADGGPRATPQGMATRVTRGGRLRTICARLEGRHLGPRFALAMQKRTTRRPRAWTSSQASAW